MLAAELNADPRKKGRKWREGLDSLDIELIRLAREAHETGRRWTNQGLADAAGSNLAKVYDRIRRLRRLGQWAFDGDANRADPGKRGVSARRGVDEIDEKILAAAKRFDQQKTAWTLKQLAEHTSLTYANVHTRYKRLLAQGLWTASTLQRYRRTRAPLDPEIVDWVEGMVPLVRSTARRYSRGSIDPDEMESALMMQLYRCAASLKKEHLHHAEKSLRWWLGKTARRLKHLMYEERRRFRAAQFWQDDNNGDFQYADTRSYEPIDCLAADDELLAFLSLLDDEEKEVLCAAIDNELSLAGAGMSLGKSGRKARAIAEWIRIKYSVYSGRTPDAGYMPTKVRRSA